MPTLPSRPPTLHTTGQPMSRHAFCPTCATVDHVDDHWRCLWCGTTTLTTISRIDARESRILTRSQLLEAHDRYARGESLTALSAAYYTGRDTLKQNFWHAGLPTRSMACSNILEAPRRRVVSHPGERNGAYRRDITDADVQRAYTTLGSLRAAADHLGCGIATVHRRLKQAGHARRPIGRPNGGRATLSQASTNAQAGV